MNCLACSEDAGYRYACDSCVDTARRRLREIETYAAMLPFMLQPMRGDAARRAPGFQSSPPLRLEAVVALDPRSRPLALERPDRDGGEFDPETDEEDPTSSVLYRLHTLARWIREEQEIPEPSKSPTITREVGYLLGAVAWCAQQQWVNELLEEIQELHAQDRRLTKDVPPGPLSECMVVTCAGTVFWSKDVPDPQDFSRTVDAAKCDTCNRVYIGVDLVRLKVWGGWKAKEDEGGSAA